MRQDVRERLISMAEPSYAKFHKKLTPGAENILGIRLPVLRALARELCSSAGEDALNGEDIYNEEIMLRGMMTGYLKLTTEKRISMIKEFVPKINNWAVCDSFCSTIKPKKIERSAYMDLIKSYVCSDREFEQRFAAVMLMKFIDDEYIDTTLSCLAKINTDAYYSSMAVAWALAECMIKIPAKTEPYLDEKYFDSMTLRRARQKMRDSRRCDY